MATQRNLILTNDDMQEAVAQTESGSSKRQSGSLQSSNDGDFTERMDITRGKQAKAQMTWDQRHNRRQLRQQVMRDRRATEKPTREANAVLLGNVLQTEHLQNQSAEEERRKFNFFQDCTNKIVSVHF